MIDTAAPLGARAVRDRVGPARGAGECFGVAFPDEFLALAEHVPVPGHRPDCFDYPVWKVAVLPDQGRRSTMPPSSTSRRRQHRPDPKTVHLLAMVDPVDETYRRTVTRQLHIGESRHSLARKDPPVGTGATKANQPPRAVQIP